MPAVACDQQLVWPADTSITGFDFELAAPVARAALLLVVVGDGYGNGEKLLNVSDVRGNAYKILTPTNNTPQASIEAAWVQVATALKQGDTFHIDFDFNPGSRSVHVYALVFSPGLASFVACPASVGYSYGGIDGGPGALSVAAKQGDLIIAGAVSEIGLTLDTADQWDYFVTAGGDSPDNVMAFATQVAAADGTFQFNTSGVDPGAYYGAGFLVVFEKTILPVPGEEGLQQPALTLGAHWNGGAAYYVHGNRAYLQGSFSSPAAVASPVGTVIASGLPAEIRPRSPVTLTVPVLHPEYATPGITLPDTVDVVIDGDTISLAALPPYINDIPDPSATFYSTNGALIEQFDTPVPYKIMVGNASWPLGAPTSPAEEGWEDLTPYLGDGFQNIDGQIRLNYARIELRGHVKAVTNIANDRWENARPGWKALESGVRNYPLLVNLPAKYTSGLDLYAGDWTTVEAADFTVVCLFTQSHDSTPDPSASDAGWKLYPENDVILLGQLQNGTIVTLPMNDNVGSWATLFGTLFGGNEMWQPLVEATPFQGGSISTTSQGQWDEGSPGNGDPDGQSNVGGLHSHSTQTWEQKRDGTNVQGEEQPGGERIQGARTWEFANNQTVAPNSGGTVVVPEADVVTPYLDLFSSAPDWCALIVCAIGFCSGGVANVTVNESHLLSPDSFSLCDGHGNPLSLDGAGNPAGKVGSITNSPTLVIGWVGRPGLASYYPYDPHNPTTALLWRTADLPRTFGASTDWTSGTPLFTSQWAEARLYVFPVPFWETRRNFILKGDILTLDGSGWQALWSPGIPFGVPGVLFPGPGSAGHIRSLPTHGNVFGPAALGPSSGVYSSSVPQDASIGGSGGTVQMPRRELPGIGGGVTGR